MEDRDLISKKELLQITGISYGQLYRWKRENLIPEAWFIKQSSFTGQETFFPRDKILKRVEMIQGLKDKYSLEELANMLSPELTNRVFGSIDLAKMPGLNSGVVRLFEKIQKKEYFTFIELLFMYILGNLYSELKINESEIESLLESVSEWLPEIKHTMYRLIICRRSSEVFCILTGQEAEVLLDSRTSIINVFFLDELSKDIKLRFNNELGGI